MAQSAAELAPEEKNRISHRGQALGENCSSCRGRGVSAAMNVKTMKR